VVDAPPPDLPGYDFQRELGRGGFADVYLYRQRLPSREVAVKVLRQTAASAEARERFENEANRMAMLSSHPGIVTIYEVGVAPDGRPFLTMEYCPHDHFGRIVRAHPLTVARALEVGIKVAAAVETAHQALILHRDVKPANILLTTYGEPALTDFGIAGGAEGEGLAEAQGVSIPFAAPEVLNGSTVGDAASDVYSLGATVYALLAGRAPFSTGDGMSEVELIQRTLRGGPPPTGRADVPPTLERVLATAMARDPANRYDSAAAFGRALQGIEAELGLAQTHLRIAEATAPATTADEADDDSTRFRGVQRVEPAAPAPPPAAAPPTAPPPAAPPPPPGAWRQEVPAPPQDAVLGDRTVARRPTRVAAPSADAPEPAGHGGPPSPDRTRLVLSVLGALVIVGALVFVFSKAGGEAGEEHGTTTTTPDTSPLVVDGPPPRPEKVRVERQDGGGQRILWQNPAPAEGDTYQVFFAEGPEELLGQIETTEERELVIETDRRICVTIETIRAGRVSPASNEVCTP